MYERSKFSSKLTTNDVMGNVCQSYSVHSDYECDSFLLEIVLVDSKFSLTNVVINCRSTGLFLSMMISMIIRMNLLGKDQTDPIKHADCVSLFV